MAPQISPGDIGTLSVHGFRVAIGNRGQVFLSQHQALAALDPDTTRRADLAV
ncbi:MAG TPA: hypothetical protein PLR41_05025 [Alphaproteobacteria bacterium]|nr:hypothetical protein [Alphaproteobacteria bacterium]